MRSIALLLVLIPLITHAATVQSTGSGNWENGATWTSGSVPACGDNIIIQSGHVVVVTTNNSSLNSCGSASYVLIYGTLDFSNGDKLHMGCGSGVAVELGGAISAAGSGGGSSNQITVCGSTVWSKSDGTLSGPTGVGTVILPIELLNFAASVKDDYATITWTTATEINNDYFVVLKSTDGMSWSKLTTIDGAGNSANITEYTVTDRLTEAGTYYYQLVQVDFNGATTTYDPVKVSYTGFQNVLPYPNPSNGMISLTNLPDESYTVQIADLSGRVVTERFLAAGSNRIDLTELPSGQYLLILINGKTLINKQIQIR